jgi:arsenate reductase
MPMKNNFHDGLSAFIDQLKMQNIPVERKQVLQPLIDYVLAKQNSGSPIRLNFICTHNSRRSQLSQIWAKTISAYFEISTECFSGGVEITAFNENAVSVLIKDGFQVKKDGEINPIYHLSYAVDKPSIDTFSKKFDDKPNPTSGFAAIMTCSHADDNCPFIPGAEIRIPVRYDDPKAFDGTSLMESKYLERSREIAAEMYFVFSQVSDKV